MHPSKHEGKELYVHTGSGLEGAHFGLHHRDNVGPRTNFSAYCENEEARRQFLVLIDRCNAAYTHEGGDVRKVTQTGGLSSDIGAGCERLGNGVNALPIKVIWELNFNYYYGVEHMTITK